LYYCGNVKNVVIALPLLDDKAVNFTIKNSLNILLYLLIYCLVQAQKFGTALSSRIARAIATF